MNASFISSSPGTLPFEKSNILLLGPSGSGKTLLLRTLAQALDVPFVHVDATPLTMAGYVGEDVESIIQRLLVQAGWDVNRAQRGIICIDEIDKLRRTGAGGGGGGGNVKDVGGEGVQQALLRMLEGTTIQVADKNKAAAAAAQQAASAGGAGAKIAKTPQEQQGHRLGDVADAEDSGAAGRLGPWYNHRRGRSSVGSTNAALKCDSQTRRASFTRTASASASAGIDTQLAAFNSQGDERKRKQH
ncbi:hypothetical protein NDA16_004467 [Ustilago loliicola]|nr:hypothetical protein NDA16_004467 [Ustilago loliicola]